LSELAKRSIVPPSVPQLAGAIEAFRSMVRVPLTVEIWSDVVCPWCYIGKRRFEKAVADFDGDVEVHWRSFELDPQAPATREHTATEHLAAKYGMSVEQAEASHAQMTELAAHEGLEYHFERARGGNSFDAHRLIHLAAAHGKQGEAQERVMRAYFTDGVPIGDREALIKIGEDMGLEDAREALENGDYADAVREDEILAQRIGIQGVPFFVLDRRYGVSGAQPADVLVQALEKAAEA
jgi:predicted DsbA family dithiol-disulfide isomerase